MDAGSLEQYKNRLEDKKVALEAVERQIEILQTAKEKRQQDYDDEKIRQEKFQELWDQRQVKAAELPKFEQGTADWYSVYTELEQMDKNINKALRGWKKFW